MTPLNSGRSQVKVNEDPAGISALIDRVERLLRDKHRVVIGIAGPPGVGKSFVSASLESFLDVQPLVVPMDGFHLAQKVLDGEGTGSRKGAIFTFDAWGFVALVRRLVDNVDPVVYAPTFDREIEEPVAGAIPIPGDARLIIVEGNYLLVEEQPWGLLKELMDEIWYLEIDRDVRINRLVERHVWYGRSEEEAIAHANGSDELNTELIESTRDRADVVVLRDPRP